MARAFSILLLVLAIFNIAHADILRPCECSPDNPLSCGSCPASKGETPASPAPC